MEAKTIDDIAISKIKTGTGTPLSHCIERATDSQLLIQLERRDQLVEPCRFALERCCRAATSNGLMQSRSAISQVLPEIRSALAEITLTIQDIYSVLCRRSTASKELGDSVQSQIRFFYPVLSFFD